MLTGTATAEPAAIEDPPKSETPPPPPEPKPAPPLTAADVRGSPPPGAEHGRLDQIDPGDGGGRKFAAALLWVPRLPIELFFQPIRGLLYLKSRRPEVIKSVDSGPPTFEYAPMILAESGLGFTGGLRLRLNNLTGLGERVEAQIAAGSSYKPLASLGIEAGTGRVEVGIVGTYEDAEQPFYGYGNGDATQATPIDPLTSDAASSTQYEAKLFQVGLHARVHLPDHFLVTGTTTLARREFEPDSPRDGELLIDEAFVVDNLPGFNKGTASLYSELELAWDTRRKGAWDAPGIHGDGGVVEVFAGRYEGLRKGDPGLFRFGVDAQRFIPITAGPRVIALRAYGEMVTGDRDEVPFTELPRLGGSSVLRGYDVDRFRDRVAAVVQANYRWRAANWLAVVLFVDAGRVYESLNKLSFDDLRVGYGAGLEMYSGKSMLLQGQVASSIDGGVFLQLSIGPAIVSPSRGGRF